MLALRQLLVETPENLHDAQRGGAHGVREIATGRRNGANNGDGARPLRVAQARHLSGALVEGSEAGGEVGGVALVGRHLRQTAGNLTQGLGPARGGVRHHGHVHAHVAEVFGEGDARVDGRLSGRHRHVGRVGDEGCALHDAVRLPVLLHLEMGKLHKNLSHLISALATTDVDNGVGVGIFGEGLGDNSLAATESTRNGAGAAKH
mmetsp:Transcript_19693/g.41311  ORF Transcript_19693/g.41311 Transcript_19693/m.41311 type:complete len:205 (-) Transcript_19693:744-1358(-)